MYYEYTLRQLLELALRVPEVGAVNFNILYYILKTIIQKQGLEGVKPVFSLDAPLSIQSNVAETNLKEEGSLRRSYSAESIQAISSNEFLKRPEKDFSEMKKKSNTGKKKDQWEMTKFFKRLDAVEEEISEIHIMIAQLVDKISNFERVSGLQETKFMKEIADLHHSLEFAKAESFAEKLQQISSDVSMLMLKAKAGNEKNTDESSDKSSDEICEYTELDDSEVGIEQKIQKPSHHKRKESEVTAKFEKLFNELNSIKEHLKLESSLEADPLTSGKLEAPVYEEYKVSETMKDERRVDKTIQIEKERSAKADIRKIDSEGLDVSAELRKLMEKFSALDKSDSDISAVKERNLNFEVTLSKYEEDMETLKGNWTEMAHSFESIKEMLQYIENEITIVTEIPGLRNRVEQLEAYVYSGYEYERESHEEVSYPEAAPADKLISKAEKVVKISKKSKAREIEDYLDQDMEIADIDDGSAHRKFQAVSRNIALVQTMEKKRQATQFKTKDLYSTLEEEGEVYLYEEPLYETAQTPATEDFGELSETVTPSKTTTEFSEANMKSSTFTSPDILEEHSRQLRGQIIVFVKKRLNDFEIELQHIEGNLVTMKRKIEFLEKSLKDFAEKLTFMDANFSQRAGDLAALKKMAESHQVSIVTIMHHLDRKAEAYAVNQKVSRKELTVIEDRVLKLCVIASSEITKLEEKIDGAQEKFNLELDKKLFIEEFQVRLEFLLHKMKILENKLKDTPIEAPVLDFEGIRPVEIKKYVVCKDGTRIKQARKKITTWKHHSSSDSIIPVLNQNHADREASPKTANQIRQELELASIRESKRHVEGAYTKIKVGRK